MELLEKEYRVIAINRKRISKGEVDEERTQYLQKRVRRKYRIFNLLSKYYWISIDSEIVPSYAIIHKAVFGDRPDWDSKFKGFF